MTNKNLCCWLAAVVAVISSEAVSQPAKQATSQEPGFNINTVDLLGADLPGPVEQEAVADKPAVKPPDPIQEDAPVDGEPSKDLKEQPVEAISVETNGSSLGMLKWIGGGLAGAGAAVAASGGGSSGGGAESPSSSSSGGAESPSSSSTSDGGGGRVRLL